MFLLDLSEQTKRELGIKEIRITPPEWVINPQSHGLKGIVINNDLDGFLSGLLYSHFTGLPIVALFDYKSLWVADGCDMKLNEMIFVDADINAEGIYSIGNHVTMFNPFEKRNPLNYNVNNMYLISNTHNFYKHYAGSTALMIAAAFDYLPPNIDGQRLLLVADGTFKIPTAYYTDEFIKKWLERLGLGDIIPLLPYNDQEMIKYFTLLDRIGYQNINFNVDSGGNLLIDRKKVDMLADLLGVSASIPTKFKQFKTFTADYIEIKEKDTRDLIERRYGQPLFANTFIKRNKLCVCF